MTEMHEIDYQIFGDDMQFVEVELDDFSISRSRRAGLVKRLFEDR